MPESFKAYVRIYSLSPLGGQSSYLEAALGQLADMLRSIEGAGSMIICRDREQPEEYTVFEIWKSFDVYKMSSSKIPKELFGAIMERLSQPPKIKDADRLP